MKRKEKRAKETDGEFNKGQKMLLYAPVHQFRGTVTCIM